MLDLTPKPELALIVGVGLKNSDAIELEQSLDELGQLTESAGATIVGVLKQRLEKIIPSTFIGAGKVEEIAKLKDDTNTTLVIIDAKLSGIQTRNLQELIGCKVIDRHQLILDIFAQRAQTREGKLQVELAQLKDQLPRLIGEAVAGLSRQAGGIGTRGPGETKLELDRRRVKTRIESVSKELEAVRQTRALHRKRRKLSHVPLVALAGYTNAGKSTLLNQLTKADAYVEDKLFATLDPQTRKLRLPSGKQVVATDTVGFINNLPLHLVEAFKATFEEIATADVILHVHDASHPVEFKHADTVLKLLRDIGVQDTPIIHVYNKIDLATPLSHRDNPFVNISAISGEGIEKLLSILDETINNQLRSIVVDLYLPTSDKDLLYKLAREGKIVSQDEGSHFTHFKVKLSEEVLEHWSQFLESEKH